MNMAKAVKENRSKESTKAVTNFMGGISYELNPLDTLKMVTASSIFGEPAYYREGENGSRVRDGVYHLNRLMAPYSVLDEEFEGKTTSEIMEDAIDAALAYDFGGTIAWARTLRKEFNMRLNPQIIMVRAANHEARVAFNEANPGVFSEINAEVMSRADEPASQMTYYMYRNGSKKNIPNILKRNWKNKLESLSRYQVAKYKNTGIGMIDVVRISHANNETLNELMKTGTVEVIDEDKTWENLRSEGKNWKEILSTVKVGHMALLRNLRGIFKEIDDAEFCRITMDSLKKGVPGGKQFPFRYYSAYNAVKYDNDVNCKTIILDALEECMDIACDNMPMLKGKTMCLSDNSGSAWGTIPSEYGTVRVAEIGNLSSVITARNSEEGYVGEFGDKLLVTPVLKRDGVLSRATVISKDQDDAVGGATENGIWLFFDKAIKNKEHWDNIFIYSDMQAGHGDLYGTPKEYKRYRNLGFSVKGGRYIDVAKLIDAYRSTVNPDVNVFCVQTAGYDNVLVPEYGYRTNVLYGWTGKEAVFAKTMIDFWDEKKQSK